MAATAPRATTRYGWVSDKRKATLLKDGTGILVLTQAKGGRGLFTYRNAGYVVQDEGFWNPRTIIERNGSVVLVLKRHFLGSKATIELADGTTFQCNVRNAPLVNLIFLGADGDTVLSYRLDATHQPRMVLEVNNGELKNDQLVLLLVLGFHMFKGVIKENDDADLVVLVA